MEFKLKYNIVIKKFTSKNSSFDINDSSVGMCDIVGRKNKNKWYGKLFLEKN